VPAADLKFGDVIRFKFAGDICTALVLATRGAEIRTDENIYALGETGFIAVLGLALDRAPKSENTEWHQVGQIAPFADGTTDYEVLS